MRWLVVLLLAGGCETVFPLEPPVFHVEDCPDVFAGETHLYRAGPIKWPNAEAECVSLDDTPDNGAYTHLAVLSSGGESVELGLHPGEHAWLGISNARRGTVPAIADEFEWITEEDAILIPWAAGNPNSGSGPPVYGKLEEDDGSVHDSDSAFGGTNGDIPVNFVCECDGFPAIDERVFGN